MNRPNEIRWQLEQIVKLQASKVDWYPANVDVRVLCGHVHIAQGNLAGIEDRHTLLIEQSYTNFGN